MDDIRHPSFPPRWTGFSGGLALLCLGLLAFLGGRPSSQYPPIYWLAVVPLLELAAASLGPFGFFSTGFAFTLLLFTVNARFALLALLVGLCARTASRGAPGLSARSLELLSDLLPQILALSAFHILASPGQSGWRGLLAALVVYAAGWFVTPGFFAGSIDHETLRFWGTVRERLGWHMLGVAATAWWLATHPLSESALVAAPMLLALGLSGRDAREAIQTQFQKGKMEDSRREIHRQKASLVQVESEQTKQSQKLDMRYETYTLVEAMLTRLAGEPALEAVAHGLIEQIKSRVACSSVAIFWESNGKLQALAAVSPHLLRVQNAEIIQEPEPIVQDAWKSGKMQQWKAERCGEKRIFLDEQQALAIPIRGKGAIYVGDSGTNPFTGEDIEFLECISENGRLALNAAFYQQAQGEALRREGSARANLQQLLERLSKLLAGLGSLVGQNEPQVILQRTQALVAQLVTHDFSWLRLGDYQTGPAPLPDVTVEALIQVLQQSRTSLYLDEMAKSRFVVPDSPIQSLLAVPVSAQGSYLGAFLLGSRQPKAFSRIDQDVMQVLAYELGGAFHGAQLFQELELTHRQLRESQAQLVQSSKMAAIGQLAGGVAHELNTPLGAISVAIEGALVNLEAHPERVSGRLGRAMNSVDKMKTIVDKLLFYSRESSLGRHQTDLNEAVEDTLELFEHQFSLDNIEISKRLSPLPTTMANRNELQQILTNLVINARDAVLSPEARFRRIEIATQHVGNQLQLTVQDGGPGIPVELRQRIFDPFFTTKAVGSGTGLGLSVSLQLIEQHRGTLRIVDPANGIGARFLLCLPVTDAAELD